MKPKNINAQFYKTNILSMILNIILFSVFFIVVALVNKEYNLMYGCLVVFIALMPFIIYYLYQYNYYQKIKLSDIQVIRLENLKQGGRRFTGFYLTMKINDKKIKLETKSVFTKLSTHKNYVGLYHNERAVVGYDRKRNEPVVIKLEEK